MHQLSIPNFHITLDWMALDSLNQLIVRSSFHTISECKHLNHIKENPLVTQLPFCSFLTQASSEKKAKKSDGTDKRGRKSCTHKHIGNPHILRNRFAGAERKKGAKETFTSCGGDLWFFSVLTFPKLKTKLEIVKPEKVRRNPFGLSVNLEWGSCRCSRLVCSLQIRHGKFSNSNSKFSVFFLSFSRSKGNDFGRFPSKKRLLADAETSNRPYVGGIQKRLDRIECRTNI